MTHQYDAGLLPDHVRRAMRRVPEEPLSAERLDSISRELALNDVLPGLELHESTAMLLDINNLYRRARSNGFSIDYEVLKQIFASRCDLRHCAAFSAVDRNNANAVAWTRWMQKVGYEFFGRDLFKYTGADGAQQAKGNMDVNITIHAMDLLSQNFNHIIIGTCDGDFTPLVQRLRQDRGRKVSVLGLSGKNWMGMSRMLAQEADYFYDLSKFEEEITYYGD